MKKTVSLILAGVMLISVMSTGVFGAERKIFTDVNGDEYYARAAADLEDREILSGYDDGSFGAEKEITRAEMAAVICRMIGKGEEAEHSTGKTDFDDVSEEHWACGYVNLAAAEGIISGDGNGKFRPDDTVLYEEAIKMTVSALEYEVIEYEYDWSAGYLYVAGAKGISEGLKGSKGENALRGDVAVMVYNGLNSGKTEYEDAYAKYIKENDSFFQRGMMLCDLNEDGVPELFSLTDENDMEVIEFHQYKDGEVITPEKDSPKTCIYINDILKPKTFHENTQDFFGMYRNKKTGQRALINSLAFSIDPDLFDIITYDGNQYSIKDESVKESDDGWAVVQKRDTVMAEYELVENEIFTHVLLRGSFGGENSTVDRVAALYQLINQFENSDRGVKYDTVTDGIYNCYIRDVNLDENEICIIPAAEITYAEYTNAMNTDKLFELNGETMSIVKENGFLYNDFGLIELYDATGTAYSFYEPSEDYPVSVIDWYLGNTPVKVKMSDDFAVRYGVSGLYDENGEPTDYETCDREKRYTAEEYFPYFAEYSMGSIYKAVIKNNQLEFLDVVFKP